MLAPDSDAARLSLLMRSSRVPVDEAPPYTLPAWLARSPQPSDDADAWLTDDRTDSVSVPTSLASVPVASRFRRWCSSTPYLREEG